MDAKEYLSRPGEYRYKLQRIEQKLDELAAEKFSLGTPSGHEVRTAREPAARFEKIVLQYDKLYSEYIRVLSAFIDVKQETTKEIERLKDVQYETVLIYRYVLGWSVEDTAERMGLSLKWTYDVLTKAVNAFQALLDGNYKPREENAFVGGKG